MIGKAKSNRSLNATITYNLKEKAELMFTNQLIGDDVKDYQIQIQMLQKCYSGVAKQLTLHVVLSPHITEGKQITTEQWQTIANKYLSYMNLEDHQAIGFVHSDKEHRHLHLVINKVKDAHLKLYHDGYIGKRTQKVADRIAKEMKLIRAMEIAQQNILNKQKKPELIEPSINNKNDAEEKPPGSKQLFKIELKRIIDNRNIQSINDYFKEVEGAGFKVHLYHNKETKELRGYGIEKNNTKMDASTIGKEFTITNLDIHFENINQENAKENTVEKFEKQQEVSLRKGVRM